MTRTHRLLTIVMGAPLATLPACSTSPTPASSAMREVFPGVRVDAASRTVEFDGTVPVDTHNPRFPRVYLEVVVTTPDTRPHEALVVTNAKAAHVHAALLLAGYTPGTPGSWVQEGNEIRPVAPTGEALNVWLVTRDASGRELSQRAESWIGVGNDNAPLPGNGWVFAGSRLRAARVAGEPDQYLADNEGTIVGLTTFTTESIAWTTVFSPDSRVQEPEWIARPDRVPKVDTPVTVRLTPVTPAASTSTPNTSR